MIKHVDPARTVDFVHPSERGAEGAPRDGATVWVLRPLTKRQRAAIIDTAVGSGTGGRSALSQFKAVRWGLAGATSYGVPFATEADPDATGGKAAAETFLDTIPDEVFRDLATEIQKLSRLSEDDAGKSSRPST